jgi:hypothetical protein
MANNKKFSISKVSEPVTFTVDDNEFEAIPANRLPAGALAKYFAAVNDNKIFDAQDLFFKAVLTEPSYKLFSDRLNSTETPITFSLLTEIASWLLSEVYLQGEASADAKQSSTG